VTCTLIAVNLTGGSKGPLGTIILLSLASALPNLLYGATAAVDEKKLFYSAVS
jgi:hypothetical protein